jgi:hypothetical protein
MSKGHIFLAQNSSTDYVRQACALALTIKKHNTISQTCLVTNDQVPAEYRHAFDHVISIPWSDLASKSEWKVENRWKLIHATPFKENLVYDVDMLLLNSNDHWWSTLSQHDLYFTTSVTDYRGNLIDNNFYRKAFTENYLPNIYTGCFYFKKNNKAFEFFKWLNIITSNWEEFYRKFLPNRSQNFVSIDLSAALALRFMDMESTAKVNLIPSFVHMKPMIQDWKQFPNKWTEAVSISFTDSLELKIAEIKQQGLFHYVEDEFLTDDILGKLLKNV